MVQRKWTLTRRVRAPTFRLLGLVRELTCMHTEKDPKDSKDKDGKDKDKDSASHPPARRYRMTDHMKSIVWELVLLSNECCRLENEKK
jgi:hypothetical protein